MKEKVRKIIESKKITIFLEICIFASIIGFTLETLPNISSLHMNILNYLEYFIVGIFTIEYFSRIYITEKKISFIFSWYGIIDLLAIAPFYLMAGIDLRSIRIIRIFRLFRIFKLFRYSKAIQNFKNTLQSIKEELILFSVLTLILLYISAVGIYYFENPAQPENIRSIFDALWWAVATLTTVGYGDVYPITAGGKFFTFIILMMGLGIVAIPTGLIAGAISGKAKNNIYTSEEILIYVPSGDFSMKNIFPSIIPST